MESVSVPIPAGVSSVKLTECLQKITNESIQFKIRNTSSLLDRKLVIFIPEDMRTSKLLVKIGIIIGVYLN